METTSARKGHTAAGTTEAATARVHADHTAVRRLGHWTAADRVEIRARRGSVLVDLRSPALPAEVEIVLALDGACVKLLVDDATEIDPWDLGWTGRGKVKDLHPAATGGRRVRLTGSAAHSEIRVRRGGMAQLAAICTREYVADARRAHQEGGAPTVDDPSRAA